MQVWLGLLLLWALVFTLAIWIWLQHADGGPCKTMWRVVCFTNPGYIASMQRCMSLEDENQVRMFSYR